MTSIFHITEISNLPSIINEGRLLCDNQMDARKLTPTNIAHSHIKVEERIQRYLAVREVV